MAITKIKSSGNYTLTKNRVTNWVKAVRALPTWQNLSPAIRVSTMMTTVQKDPLAELSVEMDFRGKKHKLNWHQATLIDCKNSSARDRRLEN